MRKKGVDMAKLKNPQNNREAIRQDYRDKHASGGGAVLVCRKYDKQVKDKKGKLVFDKSGNPVMTHNNWFEAKGLTKNEEKYIYNSYHHSEHKKNDCYCTINSFPTDCEPDIKETKTGHSTSYRSVEKLGHLTGFYIDFDHKKIHGLAKKQQVTAEMVEEVLSYADFIVATLEAYFPGDFGMPIISCTGGGYGFYWKIRPMEATEENKALYMEIWEKLYRRFNSLFEEILDIFENDHAVLDYVRVIRITGTYNSKTGTYSKYIGRYGNEEANEVYEYGLEEISNLYHLDEISKEPNTSLVSHSPLQNKKEQKEEKKENSPKEQEALGLAITYSSYSKKGNIAYPRKWYQGYANSKQLGRYLALAVKSLEYLDNQGNLQRNNALFLVACFVTEIEYAKCGEGSFYKYGKISKEARRAVIEYILELNDSLTNPLEDEEIENLLKSALSDMYHFRKRATIQKFLNLTDEEFADLGWLDKQKAEQAKLERNASLTDLDKEVIRLYFSGLSDAKIAKELNIPKLQSVRIRQRLGVTDRGMKFEAVDFDGRKRHLKHKTPLETPFMRSLADSKIYPGSDLMCRDFFNKSDVELRMYLKSEQLGREEIWSIVRDYHKKKYEYRYQKNLQRDWEEDEETIPSIDPAYSSKLISFGDSEIKNTMELWRIRGTS